MPERLDSYRHKGLRRQLVNSLRRKGISDEVVLKAILEIPRHYFLDSAFDDLAYVDQAFPIECDQTISQPFTVAYQSELLQLEKGMTVLEIGTGSGYQAAILSKMGARVFTVERHKHLYETAEALLKELNLNTRHFHRDGFKGLPEFAPFDRILMTAACDKIPEELLSQLKIGGVLVSPVGGGNTQIMKRVIRISESDYETESLDRFRFVPMIEGLN
jgi:protein-L-isoaspartate(D-aspartate) O-methyltransferase